jgi:hypothetical protein
LRSAGDDTGRAEEGAGFRDGICEAWVHDSLGRIEPDLGLAVVLEAREGVEEQEGLVRGPPAAPVNWRMPSNVASRVSRSSGSCEVLHTDRDGSALNAQPGGHP